MTLDEQRSLATCLDSHVLTLRSYCLDGTILLNALSSRLPDLEALADAAGPSGMKGLARQLPHLGHVVELLASLPRDAPSGASAPLEPERSQGQEDTCGAAPLPAKSQRTVAMPDHAGGPDAADAQAARREMASWIVLFEAALSGLLAGKMKCGGAGRAGAGP